MTAETFIIRVECYAGHRGEETPRRFWVEDRAVAVAEVLDRWIAPDHRYFKLLGDDGDVYIVRHEPGADRWELSLYSGRTSSTATTDCCGSRTGAGCRPRA